MSAPLSLYNVINLQNNSLKEIPAEFMRMAKYISVVIINYNGFLQEPGTPPFCQLTSPTIR